MSHLHQAWRKLAGTVYYHGTGRGGARALTGRPEWDDNLFVSHDPEVAGLYGPDVQEIKVSPSARVLDVHGPSRSEWIEYAGLSGRPGLLDVAIGIVGRAKSEGYDIVEFYEPHDFIGHVIMNRGVIQ